MAYTSFSTSVPLNLLISTTSFFISLQLHRSLFPLFDHLFENRQLHCSTYLRLYVDLNAHKCRIYSYFKAIKNTVWNQLPDSFHWPNPKESFSDLPFYARSSPFFPSITSRHKTYLFTNRLHQRLLVHSESGSSRRAEKNLEQLGSGAGRRQTNRAINEGKRLNDERYVL